MTLPPGVRGVPRGMRSPALFFSLFGVLTRHMGEKTYYVVRGPCRPRSKSFMDHVLSSKHGAGHRRRLIADLEAEILGGRGGRAGT